MKKNALIYVIGSFFSQGLTFLTLPIFSRLMSPADFGMLSAYTVVYAIIEIVIGFQMYGALNNAYIDYEETDFNRYIHSGIIVAAICALVISLFLFIMDSDFILKVFLITKSTFFLAIIQAFFTYIFLSFTRKLIVMQKSISFMGFSICNALVNTILSILLILFLDKNKFFGKILANVITAVLLGTVTYIISHTGVKFNKDLVKYGLRITIPIMLYSITAYLMSSVDQMMIIRMIDEESAGIYSYSLNFGKIISVLYLASNQAFVPILFDKLSNNNIGELKEIIKKYLMFFTILYCVAVCAIPFIVEIISGPSFMLAKKIAPSVCLLYYFHFLNSFQINIETYYKSTRIMFYSTLIVTLLNVLINFILISRMGILGACLASCISVVILLFSHYLFIRVKLKNVFNVELKTLMSYSFMPVAVTLLIIVLN